jgi:hypothetical protein
MRSEENPGGAGRCRLTPSADTNELGGGRVLVDVDSGEA